jgi:hypothetical protein
MVDTTEVEKLVSSNFRDLELMYGFKRIPCELSTFQFYIPYVNNELMVRIEYSLRHDYIVIAVYNDISQVRPGAFSWKHSVSLMDLLDKFSKDPIIYDDLMPKVIGLENSITRLSKYFFQYAEEILTHTKWISWGQLYNYH